MKQTVTSLTKRATAALLLAALLLAGLTGCGSSQKSTSGEPQTTTSEQPQDTNAGLNQPIELENLTITALEIDTSLGEDYFAPDEGNQYVAVRVEIENTSNEDQAISSLMLFDIYVDGVKASYSLSANVVFGDGTLDGTISPGKKLIGWIATEAAIGAQELELQVSSSFLSRSKAVFVLEIPEA